jgi:hypothetical protein
MIEMYNRCRNYFRDINYTHILFLSSGFYENYAFVLTNHFVYVIEVWCILPKE